MPPLGVGPRVSAATDGEQASSSSDSGQFSVRPGAEGYVKASSDYPASTSSSGPLLTGLDILQGSSGSGEGPLLFAITCTAILMRCAEDRALMFEWIAILLTVPKRGEVGEIGSRTMSLASARHAAKSGRVIDLPDIVYADDIVSLILCRSFLQVAALMGIWARLFAEFGLSMQFK